MPPFDLPDSLFDLINMDRRNPGEVRERKTGLSKPLDDHEHFHVEQPPSVRPPDLPRRQLMSDDVPRRWQERDREAFFAAIGESLRRRRSGLAATAS